LENEKPRGLLQQLLEALKNHWLFAKDHKIEELLWGRFLEILT